MYYTPIWDVLAPEGMWKGVREHLTMGTRSLALLWPGYFAGLQNESCKTINFTSRFPRCKMLSFISVKMECKITCFEAILH
jgi:hypothetical protein